MARQANLKTVITADASPMRSELAKAKADVKNFGKVSEGALDAFGAALGVNVGKIKEVSSAIQGMGQKMTASSNEAVKGLGTMLKGVNALSAGIAGVGVGALIAGFKGLKSEAENFSNTIDGLNMKMAHQAWISTYKQALHDANRQFGIDTAENLNDMEKGWTKFWDGTKQVALNTFAKTDWLDAAMPAVGVIRDMISVTKDVTSVNSAAKEATTAAERAAQIGDRLADIQKTEIANSVRVSELNAEIAARKLEINDSSLTAAERSKALAEAERLIKERTELQLPLIKEKADLTKELHSLTSSTVDDAVEDANLQIQVNSLLREQDQELRSLNRYAKTLTTETSKQSEEYRKQLEAIEAIKRSRADLAAWSSDITAPSAFSTPNATVQVPAQIVPKVDKDNFQYLLDSNLGFATIRVGMELDQEKLKDVSAQIESVVGNLAMGLSESIGQLVGDLVTGGDAWGNFATSAMTAFADMAQSVGKMAIEMGLATIGIKAALESLNPYLAIAAGTALVALGAAVKAGLRNVAAGNYSASASVATGSYAASPSSSAAGYSEREINIKVTGTLKASGSELVTVLNNENRRRTATT